jgi:hypothetical protein
MVCRIQNLQLIIKHGRGNSSRLFKLNLRSSPTHKIVWIRIPIQTRSTFDSAAGANPVSKVDCDRDLSRPRAGGIQRRVMSTTEAANTGAAAPVRCQRIGCDATFTDDNNPEGSCQYHPSVSSPSPPSSPPLNPVCLGRKFLSHQLRVDWSMSLTQFDAPGPTVHHVRSFPQSFRGFVC